MLVQLVENAERCGFQGSSFYNCQSLMGVLCCVVFGLSVMYSAVPVTVWALVCRWCLYQLHGSCISILSCVQVLMIGESGVGKSTLVGRLCEDRFMPEHRQYTLGMYNGRMML